MDMDWNFFRNTCSNDGAKQLTEIILDSCRIIIKTKQHVESKSSHPWLNARVLSAVRDKQNAEGTPDETDASLRCSAVVLEEYNGWKSKVRSELNGMQRGSKLWWAKERQLQLQRQKSNSTLALKDDGTPVIRNNTKKPSLTGCSTDDLVDLCRQCRVSLCRLSWDIRCHYE